MVCLFVAQVVELLLVAWIPKWRSRVTRWRGLGIQGYSNRLKLYFFADGGVLHTDSAVLSLIPDS